MFDDDGALYEQVNFPRGFTLLAVRGQMVAGVLENQDGSYSAVVHRVDVRRFPIPR